jgi:hypothetical protein
VSTAALRIANLAIECAVPWPTFSEDQLTNYLVIEAISLRYLDKRERDRAAEERSQAALAEAKARLKT